MSMNYKELKRAYIKLYEAMMNFLWPVYTVELLADLEISVCKMFPVMTDVRNNFNRLKASVMQDIRDEKKLKEAFDKFDKIIEDDVSFADVMFVEDRK